MRWACRITYSDANAGDEIDIFENCGYHGRFSYTYDLF